MNINEIIKYPILTEKTYLQMQSNVYTFAVDKRASKTEIKKAIEFIFNVKVDSINTFNVPKRPKKVGRFNGFTKAYKKAIVKLNEGSINIFPDEGIAKDVSSNEVEEKQKVKKLKEVSQAELKAMEKIKKAEKAQEQKNTTNDNKKEEKK